MAKTTTAFNRTRFAGMAPADRQAERRRLLLDAAFDLLGTEGSAATSVRGVCQAARLNPRYFYESFAGLDDLVVAVYDRLVDELGGRVLEALATAGDEPGAQVRATVDTTIGFVDEDRRRARILYVEALGNEGLARRRAQATNAFVAFVETHAVAHQGATPRGEQLGRMAAAILGGGASELMVAWIDGRLDVSRDQLVDDATELFLAVAQTAAAIAGRRTR